MFSRRIIDAKIEQAIRKGFPEPVYHSVNDCQRFVSHLNSLGVYDPERELMVSTRDDQKSIEQTLTPDELRFLRNERFLCRVDFLYWCSRYAHIKDETDRFVLMDPWMSQRIFLDIVSEMEDERVAIMLIILKARQLGLSRIISLIILHFIIFRPNRNAFMASSTEDKTGLLFDMIDIVLERLPFWMRPGEKFRREGKLLELFNGSAITLQHGRQTSGIARGTTPTVAHISELAEFDDPGSLIDASLLRAMHDSPDTFLTLEGTAEGMNNWWHNKWKSAKANWPLHRSRLRPLFLPWFIGGLYPKEDWLRAHPMPDDYAERMLPWAKAHAEMADEYVRRTPYLNKRLGSNWMMPLEQVWYYECERDAAVREKRLNKFLQEMPANDDEAFQSSNRSVFDTDTIIYYRDNAHRTPLAGCYQLRGDVSYIPGRFQPDRSLIDPGAEIIPITAEWRQGQRLDFELVPVRFDGWSLEDDSEGSLIDKIYFWEHPVPGYEYGLGIDTADGIGKDRTVIEVLRKASIYGPWKQVCELSSSQMNAIDAWPFAMALGTYYAVPGINGQLVQPRLAFECRGKGDMPQNIMRMLGWNNFHPWNDRQIDNKIVKPGQFTKLGVFTNQWFRDGMIDMLVKMLRNGEIEICSPQFVHEMESLEGDEFSQSLKAGYGGHDDRIMALGFILVSLSRWDVNSYAGAKIQAYSGRSPVPQNARVAKQYAKWMPSWQERTDQGIYVEPEPRAPVRAHAESILQQRRRPADR